MIEARTCEYNVEEAVPLLLNKRLNCKQELSLLLPSLLGSRYYIYIYLDERIY